ncbi:MAG: rubrerythrin family protein [Candidatus Omnitrophica bacterium]|nr:rubrerythrin family protein [Candidatus Omnitrophota bacterium]
MKLIQLFAFLAALLALTVEGHAAPGKTIANLNKAYRGESNAGYRYEQFAKKAESEGYAQVAKLFRAAAKAEGIHRDSHKAAIIRMGGKPDEFALDDVKVGATKENLAAAIKGETYERDVMYPEFLKAAKEDQASPAIRTFTYALAAETEHAKLYQEALNTLGNNHVTSIYVCPVCGYTVTALPDRRCPVCATAKEKFIVFE